jgi:hypothetical protein
VSLGIEEDLCATYTIGVGPFEVRGHEVVEVLLGGQNRRALIVDVEEGLQAGEVVRGSDRFNRIEWDIDPVSLGKGEHHLGLECPLNVDMELSLGKLPDE